MVEKTISIYDLFGKVDEWKDNDSAPIAKVRTKSSVIEGQILIGKNVPYWAEDARPTVIWIKAECEIPLTSIESLEVGDIRYVIDRTLQ